MRTLVLVHLMLVYAAIATVHASDAATVRVLVLAGNAAHKWHNWERTTPVIREALEKDSRISVDAVFDIEELARRNLSGYRVLILNSYCNWQDGRGISESAKKSLLDYLNNGGGLIILHFANGAFNFSLPQAAESDWPEFRKIVRRVWNHHGKGEAQSGHDAFGKFKVEITPVKSEITAELNGFEIEDELYFKQDGSEPIEPLLTAMSKVTGRPEPLAWTYNYGKARVFQSLLGHSEKTYRVPEVCEMLRRAVIWTASLQPKSNNP